MSVYDLYTVVRVLTLLASLWLVIECSRAQHRSTKEDARLYVVLSAWGLLTLYGVSEQMILRAPAGFRAVFALLVTLFTIRLARTAGSR